MTTREVISKLADLLDDKANVCSAEAILAARSGEDPAPHDKRAKSARFYAAACRTMVQEAEGLEKRLAVRQKRGAFVPPTELESSAYGREIGMPSDQVTRFTNYFETNGWKVGKGGVGMRDWKAAMRNWLATYRESHRAAPPKSQPSRPQDPEGWREYLRDRSIAYQPYLTMCEAIRHEFREKVSK